MEPYKLHSEHEQYDSSELSRLARENAALWEENRMYRSAVAALVGRIRLELVDADKLLCDIAALPAKATLR